MKRKSIIIGFVIAFLILISIHYLVFTTSESFLETKKSISQSEFIILTSEQLLSNLNAAESSRHNFFFSGDLKNRKQSLFALSRADSVIAVLKKAASNNPVSKKAIDSLSILIDENKFIAKMSFNSKLLMRDSAVTKNESVLWENEPLKKISGVVSRIQIDEEKSINELKADSKAYSKYRQTYQVIGFSIILLLFILAVALMTMSSRKRVETEKALEESKNWFYTTLKSIGDGVIVTNHLGDITFMNPVAQNLTGWNEKEAKGIYLEHIFNVINEDTREKIENPIASVFKYGKITGLGNYNLLIHKEGREIPIDDSAAPIISNDGTIMGVILVFRDVSERRKAERELLRNQKFIQGIADSIPNILYVYEIKGPRVIYANNKLKEILGYSADDVIKMESDFFNKLIHPEDYKRLVNYFNGYRRYSDREVMESEFRIRNSQGQWRWLHNYDVIFTRDNEGKPFQIVGTALDVTEKKTMEEQLKKYSIHLEETVKKRTSELVLTNEKLKQEIIERIKAEKSISEAEEKFRSLVEYSLVGIYIIQDNLFVYTNPKFEEIFGYEGGKLNGLNIYTIVHPDFVEIVKNNIKLTLENSVGDIQYTFKGLRKDGRDIDVEVRGSKMIYNDKLAFIGSLNDVTEREISEEYLKKSLKEKELLLQEIHHRVKNNLQIIVSLLKLQSKYIFDKRDLEIFNKSRARVETMSLIHEKLYKSANLENINMTNYLNELTGHLFKAYGVNHTVCKLKINSADVNLEIDTAIPCGLIINELVSNALKHAFRLNQIGEIDISLSNEQGCIILSFSDNGIGLPKDFIVENSDSLGLQLVSTLVKQIDGELSIDSSCKGTTFKIRFPELMYKERI